MIRLGEQTSGGLSSECHVEESSEPLDIEPPCRGHTSPTRNSPTYLPPLGTYIYLYYLLLSHRFYTITHYDIPVSPCHYMQVPDFILFTLKLVFARQHDAPFGVTAGASTPTTRAPVSYTNMDAPHPHVKISKKDLRAMSHEEIILRRSHLQSAQSNRNSTGMCLISLLGSRSVLVFDVIFTYALM